MKCPHCNREIHDSLIMSEAGRINNARRKVHGGLSKRDAKRFGRLGGQSTAPKPFEIIFNGKRALVVKVNGRNQFTVRYDDGSTEKISL